MYVLPLYFSANDTPTTLTLCVQAIASLARDLIIAGLLFSLAIGSTIACCLFSPDGDYGTKAGIKAAAYFWMLAALLAWWRVTVYLIEEAYGPDSMITKFFPIFRTPMEKRSPLVMPGLGEPGVKRGVPKMIPVKHIQKHEMYEAANGATNGA